MGTTNEEGSARWSLARVVVEGLVSLAAAALLWWAWRADAHWFERHFTESRCMRSAGEIHRVAVWRWVGAFVALVLSAFARPRLGRWAGQIARLAPAQRVIAIARVVVPVVLAFCVSELWLKYKADRHGGSMAAPMRDSPAYGSEMIPSMVTSETVSGREISYATNADGARVLTPGEETDYAAPTILFTGESIVFGQGVNADEAFPFLVGRHLDVHVADLAAIGYSGVNAYLRVKDALPRFAKPVAVVSIFLPELLERNVGRYRRVRLGEDGSLTRITPEPLWTHFLHTRWIFRKAFPFNAEDDEAVAVERALLHETAQMARARGAMPLFVVTHYGAPCVAVEGESPWLLRTLFDDKALPVVNVELDETWVVPGDKHPDARAHAKIAAAVEQALRGAHLAGL